MNDDQPEHMTIHQTILAHTRADRALRLAVTRALEQFNVTLMEWLLIGTVGEHGSKGATMTDVAVRLDVTLPQITALTIRLTKAKLLKQKLSRRDRRSRKLYCTPPASKMLSGIETLIRQTVDELVSGVSPEQFQGYVDVIQLLADRKPGSIAQKA